MDKIQNKRNYMIKCPECILIPSIKMKFENNEIEHEYTCIKIFYLMINLLMNKKLFFK